MKATHQLHEMGQSLWLDNITRQLLTSGTLKRYIDELGITGLTSNPTIFDHAIKNSHDYDDAIRQEVKEGKSEEALFFELALEGAAVVGGLDALAAALYSIGIPKDSILKYETALKTEKFLLIAHGSPAEATKAHQILRTTPAADLGVHLGEPMAVAGKV